jgi:hypothetical protein
MYESLRLIRGTPEGVAARQAIDQKVFSDLRKIVESGPGFIDSKARRSLGPLLRRWAMSQIRRRDECLPLEIRRHVHEKEPIDKALKRPEFDPEERRGVDKKVLASREAIRKLELSLEQAAVTLQEIQSAIMDKSVATSLRSHLVWPAGYDNSPRMERVAPIRRELGPSAHRAALALEIEGAWHGEVMTMRQNCSRLVQAVRTAKESWPDRTGGPNERSLHAAAVQELWFIWRGVTGRQAARQGDTQRRSDDAFYRFVHRAVRAIWPGAPELSGVIGTVCTRLRSELRS